MRRQVRSGVAFEERHELRLEHVRRREIRRHHSEQPVAGERRDPLRHRRAALAQVDERFGEDVDERIQIEQRFDVSAGQDQHHDGETWPCTYRANLMKSTCPGLVYTRPTSVTTPS